MKLSELVAASAEEEEESSEDVVETSGGKAPEPRTSLKLSALIAADDAGILFDDGVSPCILIFRLPFSGVICKTSLCTSLHFSFRTTAGIRRATHCS
jgi:hypothetical protein